jgi:hypothetical protein
MGIRIDPTPPKGNWKGALPKAIDALSKVLGQSYLEAGASSYEAITAFRSKEESLEQRVWTLWRESLGLALEDFFRTSNLYRQPEDQEEFGRIIEGILTDSAKIARTKNAVLASVHLSKPTEFPLYRALREQVPGLAEAIAPGHRQRPEGLQRRLDASYQRAFLAAWTRGLSHFKALAETFDGPVGEAVRRDEDWQRYYEHLAWQVEENPLFGQPQGGASLARIFVRLRCYWRELPDKQRTDDEQAELKVTVHVNWLPDELQQWLDEEDKNDTLRIITGGPGSGKSSSAKMFARDVAWAGHYNVYFVSLHGLDVSTSIEQVVDSYVQWAALSQVGLPESPLKWLRTDYKPLLLIFDGLDEVARPDREGPEVTRKFVSNLRHWLGGANGGRELKVKALTLGRPKAAEDAADEISLASRALIHVAPLCPLDEGSFRRGAEGEIEVSDPPDLSKIEQRMEYWANWTNVEPTCPTEPPKGLFEASLRDLTIEPLLLYLLIYSGYAGEKWEEAAENRNRVYEAIFRKVHERDAKEKGHQLKEHLKDEAAFFTLMECLGLAAWRGGGRTGDTALFEQLRDSIYAPEKARDFKGVNNADLDNVALQFYTRRSGGEQPGYTFIHKSFGEYLAARGLIEAGEKWLEDYRRRPRPEIFAADWLKLTGHQRVTPELMKFMTDEARLRVKRHAEAPLDWQGARERVEQLCRIAGWMLRHGLPAHGDIGANDGGTTWRRREQIQRNGEEALYALVQVWAEAGYPTDRLNHAEEVGGWQPGPIKIDWPDFTAVSSLFRRLVGPISFDTALQLFLSGKLSDQLGINETLFSRWSLKNQGFGSANLRGLNLFGSDLSGADIAEGALDWVKVPNSPLQGARLTAVKLRGADLQEADLQKAKLESASLRVANLRGAKLCSAVLSNADLSHAQLQMADLRGTDLLNAKLR